VALTPKMKDRDMDAIQDKKLMQHLANLEKVNTSPPTASPGTGVGALSNTLAALPLGRTTRTTSGSRKRTLRKPRPRKMVRQHARIPRIRSRGWLMSLHCDR
jgi:hypothetical protein